MNPQPSLETDRLLLRAFESTDTKAVQRLAGDKRVSETTENIPHPYLDGYAESWISTHKPRWDKREGLTYAITLLGSNTLVGAVGFVQIIGSQAEVGYWIGHPYWGRGYCTEAVKKLVVFGFENLQIQRIHAKHLSANPASGRVLAKAGFSHLDSCQEHRSESLGLVSIELYETFSI